MTERLPWKRAGLTVSHMNIISRIFPLYSSAISSWSTLAFYEHLIRQHIYSIYSTYIIDDAYLLPHESFSGIKRFTPNCHFEGICRHKSFCDAIHARNYLYMYTLYMAVPEYTLLVHILIAILRVHSAPGNLWEEIYEHQPRSRHARQRLGKCKT